MRNPTPLVILIVSLLLLMVTGPKLVKMARIKGWLPGGTVQTAVVMSKGSEPGRYEMRYWADWCFGTVQPGHVTYSGEPNRTWVHKAEWDKIHEYSQIEVVAFRGGREVYYRNSIFVDPGNFAFDFVLLTAEVIGILVGLFGMVRGRSSE
jgi:hypothetical protein